MSKEFKERLKVSVCKLAINAGLGALLMTSGIMGLYVLSFVL